VQSSEALNGQCPCNLATRLLREAQSKAEKGEIPTHGVRQERSDGERKGGLVNLS